MQKIPTNLLFLLFTEVKRGLVRITPLPPPLYQKYGIKILKSIHYLLKLSLSVLKSLTRTQFDYVLNRSIYQFNYTLVHSSLSYLLNKYHVVSQSVKQESTSINIQSLYSFTFWENFLSLVTQTEHHSRSVT